MDYRRQVEKMSGIQKIVIDQQLAELGIKYTPGKLNIKLPRMKMRITNEPAQMQIERKAPSFRINRKKINSESGLKAPLELAQAYRDEGRTGALRGVKIAADDGNFLGETRRKGDRVPQLARSKTMSALMKKQQLNIGLMPKNRPEVVWDKGSMSINWSKHSIVIDWDGEFMPQMTIDPKYSVEIFMRTEPYFRVAVEEMDYPGKTGRYVDQAI